LPKNDKYGYSFSENINSNNLIIKENLFNQEINMNVKIKNQKDFWTQKAIPTFMIIMGVGIASIWIMDITSGEFSGQGNFFQWKNYGGEYLWPHICAEYLTAIGLFTGGVGLIKQKKWAVSLSCISLGALTYTSLNSLGWTFVEKERYGYAVPMLVGLTGSIISIKILISKDLKR
jgi:hypothetical protein